MSDLTDDTEAAPNGESDLVSFLRDAIAHINGRLGTIECTLAHQAATAAGPPPAAPAPGAPMPIALPPPFPLPPAGDDPLAILLFVGEQIPLQPPPLANAAILAAAELCKTALNDLRDIVLGKPGTSYPPAFNDPGNAGHELRLHIEYQRQVRAAYIAAVAALLDAARARDPYAPQLQIA